MGFCLGICSLYFGVYNVGDWVLIFFGFWASVFEFRMMDLEFGSLEVRVRDFFWDL